MPSVQQVSSSSTCLQTDFSSVSAALAGQQQSARQLLKYLDAVTYAYAACAGADTTDNHGGQLGHLPAAEMMRQGVFAVGCRMQQSRCTKPTATGAAAVYTTVYDLTRVVLMAANKQLRNVSGSSKQ
jgi:hypothetical protein